MADLRVLTNSTIRKYHESYYRPDNLCLIIVGHLSLASLFSVLARFEDDSILSKPKLSPLPARPFHVTPLPVFDTNIAQRVQYPSEDEENGAVTVGWRCNKYLDFATTQSLELVFTYLTDSAISPLQKRFIEIAEPLCGEVSFHHSTQLECSFVLEFEGVPTAKLEQIEPVLFETLSQLHASGIDMKRLRSLINREKRQLLNNLEHSPASAISHILVNDFLYGETNNHFQLGLSGPKLLDTLLQRDASYWNSLIAQYLVRNPHATVIAAPSIAFGNQMRVDETARVAAQVATMKEADADALNKAAAKLSDAIKTNNVPPPTSLLSSFPSPDIARVPPVPVFTIRQPPTFDTATTPHPHAAEIGASLITQAPLSSVPFPVQIDHIPSSFVSIRVLLDTEFVDADLKLLSPLFREAMFELPIRNPSTGELIPSDTVIFELDSQSTEFSNAQGFGGQDSFMVGSFAQFLIVKLTFDNASFDQLIQWTQDLIFNSVFTKERLRVAAKRLLSEMPRRKNEGNLVVKSSLLHVAYNETSSHHACQFLRQQLFLKGLVSELDKSEESAALVISRFNEFRSQITALNNIRVHVTCDVMQHSNLVRALASKLLPSRLLASSSSTSSSSSSSSSSPPSNISDRVVFAKHHVHPLSKMTASRGAASVASPRLSSLSGTTSRLHPITSYIVPVPASESSYLLCVSSLPLSFWYDHPDAPALQVLLEYLTTLEGPLWKRIRGQGLSYGYGIRTDTEGGLLVLNLFKSTNAVGAYNECLAIAREFSRDTSAFNEVELLAAKNSLAYSLLSETATIHSAASDRLLNSLKRLPFDHTARFLAAVKEVDIPSLLRVHQHYVMPLFDSANSLVLATVNPSYSTTCAVGLAAPPHNRHTSVVNHLLAFFVPEASEAQLTQENLDKQDDDDEGDGEDDEEGDDDGTE